MTLPLRFAALILAFYVLVFVSGPTPAQAIPIAGAYEFTSGLTGTFISDGTKLTVWNIGYGFEAWYSNQGTTPLLNTSTDFLQTGYFFGTPLGIAWENHPVYANQFCVTTDCTDGSWINYTIRSTNPDNAVPAPGTFWPFAGGFLLLLAYDWRQRRQAGKQVG